MAGCPQPRRDGVEFRRWIDQRVRLYGIESVARCIGSTPDVVRGWLDGERLPRISSCRNLAREFDTPLTEVLWMAGHLPLERHEWDFTQGVPTRETMERLYQECGSIAGVSRELKIGFDRAREWLQAHDLVKGRVKRRRQQQYKDFAPITAQVIRVFRRHGLA